MKIKVNQGPKNRLINVLLLLFSIVISLVLGEISVRIFSPQELRFNISQWDKYVGFNNIPNIEGYTERPEFKMFVKINSHGLRDREYPYQKPPNTVRIGVFGDSYTFGEGVQNDETYAKRLENMFRTNSDLKRLGINVEVLNFGIGKTGTSHQLALYQKEGKKYNLDIVILGFLSRNDFDDNWSGVFYLRDDELIHNPAAYSTVRRMQKIIYYIPFYKWASTHSHLVNLFRKIATIYDDRKRTQAAQVLNANVQTIDDAELSKEKIHLTYRLLEEFKMETELNNSIFLFLNLPFLNQKALSDYFSGEIIPPYVDMCGKLLDYVKNSNIQFLDLVPLFSKLPVSPYYFVHDQHMTKFGHQVVASNIYKFILPKIFTIVSKMPQPTRSDDKSL